MSPTDYEMKFGEEENVNDEEENEEEELDEEKEK
jgi:hypothetical protein